MIYKSNTVDLTVVKDGKDAAVTGDTPPEDKSYLWCDTSDDPPQLKHWNGTEWVIVGDTSEVIAALKEEIGSDLKQTADAIKSNVYENVYVKGETEQLVSSVRTEVEQTKNSWQVVFDTFKQDLDDLAAGNDAAFERIRKYVRIEDGEIVLGNSESPLILRIRNDRMSFLQNGYEVAYISDRKMYNTVCEIVQQLNIGDSAWIVEENADGDTVVSLIGI